MNPRENLYQSLRDDAQTFSDNAIVKHPCKKGNGTCCSEDAMVLDGDVSFILDGFRSGDLEIEILHSAVQRALDDSGKCPFLDENALCSIYERRPLICISNNATFLPRGDANLARYDKLKMKGRLDARIPLTELAGQACNDCYSKLEKSKNRKQNSVPLKLVLESATFINQVMLLADPNGDNEIVKSVPDLIFQLLEE